MAEGMPPDICRSFFKGFKMERLRLWYEQFSSQPHEKTKYEKLVRYDLGALVDGFDDVFWMRVLPKKKLYNGLILLVFHWDNETSYGFAGWSDTKRCDPPRFLMLRT